MNHIEKFEDYKTNEVFGWLRKKFNSDEDIGIDILGKIKTEDFVITKVGKSYGRVEYKFKIDEFDIKVERSDSIRYGGYYYVSIDDSSLELSEHIRLKIFYLISNMYQKQEQIGKYDYNKKDWRNSNKK